MCLAENHQTMANQVFSLLLIPTLAICFANMAKLGLLDHRTQYVKR